MGLTEMEKDEVEKLIRENPHLKRYLDEISKKMELPRFYSKVPRDLKEEPYPNIIYPTKGEVFIHIYRVKGMDEKIYHAVEPTLTEEEKKKRDKILEMMYERACFKTDIKTQDELREAIKELMDKLTVVDKTGGSSDEEKKGFLGKLGGEKVRVTPEEKMKIEYDIIHSKDVSLKGPSMTIRKFSETPISVTQLIKWGTFDAGVAAYLWLCLQYGRSLFVCGETASGKTTTTNAIIPFIPPEKKIFTAENTPEVIVPHAVWQQLLTKTTGPKEGHIELEDLLKAALRSRPDYIIPGETRGIEGRVVFQAMQTGHPVITTFHAGSVTKVIQRFTGHPISIPKTFMDNLDVVLIQMAVERKGKRIRRVLSVEEIEGYNKEVDGIMSRRAFEWNPVDDTHLFRANRNSFILEERIAKNAGYTDKMQIYEEFDKRKRIMERMVEENILDYYEVVQMIWTYYREGEKGLPISI